MPSCTYVRTVGFTLHYSTILRTTTTIRTSPFKSPPEHMLVLWLL